MKSIFRSREGSARPRIRDIGVPVRAVTHVHLNPGCNRDGNPCVYATMGQRADNFFVLQIDLETGDSRQFFPEFPPKDANYPTGVLMSRTGCLYIGAAYAGHLFCFDPEKDMLEDLGAVNPRGGASFVCGILEDEEGRIWIGSYDGADLTSYDPETGTFTNYGSMDDIDQYNYISLNADGNIVCSIRQTRPHQVAFDPETGEKQTVGPTIAAGSQDTVGLHRGNDGYLYINSNLGYFKIEGTRALPVEELPDPPSNPAPPEGISYAFADADGSPYRKLEIRNPDGEVRMLDLSYEASGTDIFYLHTGPDGCIYGSSILPLRLFRYHPGNGDLIELGECSKAGGEVYSMANLDGKLYISSYGGSYLSVYDPSLPYHFGDQSGDNPRDLGRICDLGCRPRSTLTGPLGRVWVASLPNYGCWGSLLSYYDPRSGEMHTYEGIAGEASCYTLADLEDQELIAVGTSISGGTGAKPKVDQAVLFFWDYQKEKKVWEGTIGRPAHSFNALLRGPDGRLYGTILIGKGIPVDTTPTDREYGANELRNGDLTPEFLFVFDPISREFTECLSLPPGRPLDLGLQNGPDGKIYGFTTSCIYRLDPETLTIEEIIQEKNAFSRAGPILGNDIYFATQHQLRSVRIF